MLSVFFINICFITETFTLNPNMFSISGENKHFGAPTNPAAPDRVPGGCSSGSAAAVAGGLVDFSLGEFLFCNSIVFPPKPTFPDIRMCNFNNHYGRNLHN